MTDFTGVKNLFVRPDAIEEARAHNALTFDALEEFLLTPEEVFGLGLGLPPGFENSLPLIPNLNVILTCFRDGKKSVEILRVPPISEGQLLRIKDYSRLPLMGLTPRNKEQNMLLNTLMDERIRCQVIVGKAGSGKSILSLCYALHQLFEAKRPRYERIILTRPMSSVGKDMGAFPGEAEEKMAPYLGNFYDNFEKLMGKNGREYLKTAVEKKQIVTIPLQLIGGCSWHNAVVIADEVQSLTKMECYALGTRIAEGSKLILMGDYKQRYGRTGPIENTGLYHFFNSAAFQNSPITAGISLLKIERSELARVFDEAFSDL